MNNKLLQQSSCVLAAIDVGTVSTRLFVAQVDAAGRVQPIVRQSTITNLGQGVDATGSLASEAIARTLECVISYGLAINQLDEAQRPQTIIITLTSAARDAANSGDLLDGLRKLGLEPQIIPGEVEARLSLLGVTSDFVGQDVLVADVGGGSTELAQGRLDSEGTLHVGRIHSFDVGCRRVTERFFSAGSGVPSQAQVDEARAFVRQTLAPFFAADALQRDTRQDSQVLQVSQTPACVGDHMTNDLSPCHVPCQMQTLACVGGTATSLVAVANRLVPYDSSFVHLHHMPRAQVGNLATSLLAMTVEQLRELPGLQPKRADVIAAGALIIDELLELGGFEGYIASESDSLYGLIACEYASATGATGPLAPLWEAQATPVPEFVDRCLSAGQY